MCSRFIFTQAIQTDSINGSLLQHSILFLIAGSCLESSLLYMQSFFNSNTVTQDSSSVLSYPQQKKKAFFYIKKKLFLFSVSLHFKSVQRIISSVQINRLRECCRCCTNSTIDPMQVYQKSKYKIMTLSVLQKYFKLSSGNINNVISILKKKASLQKKIPSKWKNWSHQQESLSIHQRSSTGWPYPRHTELSA